MERWYAQCIVCSDACSGSLQGCEDWADDHERNYENHTVVVNEDQEDGN